MIKSKRSDTASSFEPSESIFKSVILSMRMISRIDKVKVLLLAFLNILLSLIDLMGVIFIGLTISLAINGPSKIGDSGRIGSLLEILHLQDMSFYSIIRILGVSAILLLVLRSLISIFIGRRSLIFLSNIGAKISKNLFGKILKKKVDFLQAKSSQEIMFALTTGVENATSGVLGNSLSLISDSSTLILLSLALFVYDPLLALSTLCIFCVTGVVLHMSLHRRASQISVKSSSMIIRSQELIIEAIRSFREMATRGTASNYDHNFFAARSSLARNQAELLFMPQISKYVFDVVLVIGVFLISVTQFYFNDSVRAVSNIAVFFAAATRISPSVLRVQQGFVQLKTQCSLSAYAHELSALINQKISEDSGKPVLDRSSSLEMPTITITGLSFKYENSENFVFKDVNLSIPFGSVVAITGNSGAGKSTFADLIMGLLEPTTGEIKIGDLAPESVINYFPGKLAYVPQEVYIANTTIKQNLHLGESEEKYSDKEINAALVFSQLDSLVLNSENGLDSRTGENGSKLSGGQRQRLGIARAILTNPKIIIFDEATSALDNETENAITESINALRGRSTVLIIAHRESSIKSAEIVVKISNGEVTLN
jgi:ABC-type multidrug transport system fused ATPase/permease subunit